MSAASSSPYLTPSHHPLSLSSSHTSSSHPHPHPRIPSLHLRLCLSHTTPSPLSPSTPHLHFWYFPPGWRCSPDLPPFSSSQSKTFVDALLSNSDLLCYFAATCGGSLVLWFYFCQPSHRVQPHREGPCWDWTCVSLGVRCWSCCG